MSDSKTTQKWRSAVPVLCVLYALVGAARTGAEDEPAYDCVVDPSQLLTLGSSVIGVLDEVLVARGDRVMRGQALARLESSVEEASLAIRTLQAQSLAHVKSREAQLDYARQQLDRALELRKTGAIPAQQVEEYEANHAVALQELEKARHDAQRFLLEQRLQEEVLAQRTILSPINGVVQKIERGAGEYVFQEASILTVAQLDPLYVEVFVPIERYGDIAVGMSGTVELSQPRAQRVSAEVLVVDSMFDTASDTLGVRLALPNPEGAIPAGQRCRVSFSP